MEGRREVRYRGSLENIIRLSLQFLALKNLQGWKGSLGPRNWV